VVGDGAGERIPRLRSGRAGAEEDEGHDLCPFCGSATAGETAIRLSASRNRQLQVTRQGGRKLFARGRKELFLQWFAATGNLGFAASQAGVTRQTVSKHRLKDPEFEAAYAQAVMLCVPDLQARLHSHVIGTPKLDAAGGLAPPDEGEFDPQLAIQILRELQRYHAGMVTGGGVGRIGGGGASGVALKRGRRPRTATNAEVKAALVKRLVVFGIRVGEEEAPSSGPGAAG
jgi:hypothetical protein